MKTDFVGRVSDADTLVAFFPGVPAAQRDDIQDALLYAHLFASHQHDVQQQWHGWMHYYRDRLGKSGFKQQSLVVKDSVLLGSRDDIETASFRILGTAASDRIRELVRSAVAHLGIRQMALAYFDSGLWSAQAGSFQVVPCEMADTGQVAILLCALRVSTDQDSPQARRLIMHFKGGSYFFVPEAYDLQRQAIRDYLAGKANAVIRQIQL
ncbi:hypothetical protein IFR09_08855 [Pseudomonas syringae]|nr:hypothetical protein [Pseudomonas syringae]MBD8575494.1 hypothetical protein [Pseudomonas syringae]MBD8788727.1 hypothetical protein [Pseudomonas syringae]MBD8801785.1 hypothetical protein [Pseudomonas syringae]MBD8811270.1 hypothetical protein [Pseudomonas syringae]